MKNKLLYSLLLSFSFNALAENYAVFMGGGGEPKGNKTMFDIQIPRLKKAVDSKTWKTQIAFNGGHKNTEAVIQKNFGAAPPFTTEAFKRIIQDYKKKIEDGTIKPGDQLLLHVDTHGAENNSWNKEKSHSIATSGGTIQDYNTGAGSTLVSMDELDGLIKLASDKGVKLALLDFSCHSGNSLALNQPNTCIISATGPNHYAYGGTGSVFSSQFVKNMKKGRSLEDVFLEARKNTRDKAFPMISSPVGLDLNEEIYKAITPYMYDYDPSFDKFSPYLLSEIEEGASCEAPEQLESLLKLIDEVKGLKNISKEATYGSKEAEKLKSALKEYYSLMDQLKKQYTALNVPQMKTKEKFCSPYTIVYNNKYLKDRTEENCVEYSLQEMLSSSFDWAEKYYTEMSAKTDEYSKKYGQGQLENLKKVRARKEELLKQYPDMEKRKTFFQDQPKLESKTRSLAWKVSEAQQDFYNALYRQRAKEDTRPNPCKDFVL